MGNSLDELTSYMRPLVEALLDECEAQGVPCRVVDTGRTVIEQIDKIKHKVSWTNLSKHLPQPPEQKSEAIDIVPNSVLEEHKADWDPDHPDWLKIGLIGESLGLEWGGRWKHLNNGKGDPSHFQFVHKKQDAVAGVTTDIAE